MSAIDRAPRKKPTNLWRAALYGAVFMIVVRIIHSATTNESFFPSNPNEIGEVIGYLAPGIVIFTLVAWINNRRIKNRA